MKLLVSSPGKEKMLSKVKLRLWAKSLNQYWPTTLIGCCQVIQTSFNPSNTPPSQRGRRSSADRLRS